MFSKYQTIIITNNRITGNYLKFLCIYIFFLGYMLLRKYGQIAVLKKSHELVSLLWVTHQPHVEVHLFCFVTATNSDGVLGNTYIFKISFFYNCVKKFP